jgi:adenine C2-methylase RlmN of 23S rRNA A2503 and tRNA A37
MNLKSMTLTELSQLFKELGEPGFRAKQVYTWLHKGVRSYSEMTNLPQTLRQKLEERYPICPPEVAKKQVSKLGEDAKVAIRNIRRDAMDKSKDMKKNSEMTEDEQKISDKNVQDLTDKYIKEIDGITAAKEKEIMEI